MTCLFPQLPPELLGEIFIQWADMDADGAWMASSVCKHWRSVVLDCPLAWSKISLTYKLPLPKEDDEWCIEEDDIIIAASPRDKPRPLALWIERSGTSDIFLSLDVQSAAASLESSLSRMLDAFTLGMSRLRELVLTADWVTLPATLLGLMGPAPRLRRVVIALSTTMALGLDFPPIAEVPVLAGIWHALEEAPAIEELICRECYPPEKDIRSLSSLRLRLLSIVKVPLTRTDIWNMLDACPNLTFLQLSNILYRVKANTDVHMNTLPALAELSLRDIMTCDCADLLPSLVLPNLRVLNLRNCGWFEFSGPILSKGTPPHKASSKFGDVLVQFVQRAVSLDVLHLSSAPLSDRHLVRVLQNLPGLSELRLEDMLVGAPALRALTPSRPVPTSDPRPERLFVCPRLQRLVVAHCDLLSGHLLVDFLKARELASTSDSPTALPILSLGIEYCKKVNEEHIQAVRDVTLNRIAARYFPWMEDQI